MMKLEANIRNGMEMATVDHPFQMFACEEANRVMGERAVWVMPGFLISQFYVI